MKIIVVTMAHWENQSEAQGWKRTLTYMLNCCQKFVPPYQPVKPIIACGTWSDPELCPIEAEVINCHCDRNANNFKGADGIWHCDELFNCLTFPAFSAGLAYALWAKWPWDLALWMYHKNTIIGQDLGPVLEQFINRGETLLAPSIWDSCPDLSLSVWKKEAIVKYTNCRFRPNLVRFKEAPNQSLYFEREIKSILGNEWWNPWPHIHEFRIGSGVERANKEEVLNRWPAICSGPQEWLDEFLKLKGLE